MSEELLRMRILLVFFLLEPTRSSAKHLMLGLIIFDGDSWLMPLMVRLHLFFSLLISIFLEISFFHSLLPLCQLLHES